MHEASFAKGQVFKLKYSKFCFGHFFAFLLVAFQLDACNFGSFLSHRPAISCLFKNIQQHGIQQATDNTRITSYS